MVPLKLRSGECSALRYRTLGKSNISVSEIGFGTWGLGGTSYGSVDDNVSRDALRVAIDRGVNFFDTSDFYGAGHSETILGDVISPYRENLVITTKGGMLPHDGFDMPQDFSVHHLTRSIENSLKRLRTSYVDVYLLHSPPTNLLNWDDIFHLLNAFRD